MRLVAQRQLLGSIVMYGYHFYPWIIISTAFVVSNCSSINHLSCATNVILDSWFCRGAWTSILYSHHHSNALLDDNCHPCCVRNIHRWHTMQLIAPSFPVLTIHQSSSHAKGALNFPPELFVVTYVELCTPHVAITRLWHLTFFELLHISN